MAGHMRRLTSAAAAAVAVLALAGCGDDAVYTSRSMPTSAEDSYSAGAKSFWSEDKEVYELPANPPAIDDLHRTRAACARPGQKMKPTTLAGVSDVRPAAMTRREPTLISGRSYQPDPLPLAALPDTVPVAGWHHESETGAREPLERLPLAGLENRPASQKSSGTDRRQHLEPLVGVGEADIYCGEGAPPTSPLR
jgi:hypothetical protein